MNVELLDDIAELESFLRFIKKESNKKIEELKNNSNISDENKRLYIDTFLHEVNYLDSLHLPMKEKGKINKIYKRC